MVVIACTTQNRRHITAHAGKCRHFMIRRVEDGAIGDWEDRRLERDQTLCGSGAQMPVPLQDVDVLVTAGAGPGLRARLARLGVQVVVTDILLPDQAVAAWLAGTLQAEAPAPASASAHRGCGCGGRDDTH